MATKQANLVEYIIGQMRIDINQNLGIITQDQANKELIALKIMCNIEVNNRMLSKILRRD